MIERTITDDLFHMLLNWAGDGCRGIIRIVETKSPIARPDIAIRNGTRWWHTLDDQYSFAIRVDESSGLGTYNPVKGEWNWKPYAILFPTEQDHDAFTAFLDEFIAEKGL